MPIMSLQYLVKYKYPKSAISTDVKKVQWWIFKKLFK